MRIRYLQSAARDLESISAYLHGEAPAAAEDVLDGIREAIERLTIFPEAGRLVKRGSLRKVAVPRSPYLVFYRAIGSELRILRVRHGRRRPLRFS